MRLPMPAFRRLVVLAFWGFVVCEQRAHADDEYEGPVGKEPRTEWAGFPLVAGSSDIGVQLGGVGVVTRFSDGVQPYRVQAKIIASASFKDGPRGFETAQHSDGVQLDIPHLFGGRFRLMPGVFFDRTVNSGYFGLGNASAATPGPGQETIGARYQFIHQELRSRLNARYDLDGPWKLLLGTNVRGMNPKRYPGSKLDEDWSTKGADGSPLLYGTGPTLLGIAAAGIAYDSRNNEVVPTRGALHEASLRVAAGIPTERDVTHGALNVTLRRYVSLAGQYLVLAGRVLGDAQVGHVPFYDLSQGGAFVAMDMPGGAQGIRGIPNGRYSGKLKAVANLELRSMFLSTRVLGEKFRVGGVVFGDTGRVWNDYTFRSPSDGKGLGLKYGVGGGLYLLWGEAAIFRLEFAYAPEATAANPGFPIGIYAADGQMF